MVLSYIKALRRQINTQYKKLCNLLQSVDLNKTNFGDSLIFGVHDWHLNKTCIVLHFTRQRDCYIAAYLGSN